MEVMELYPSTPPPTLSNVVVECSEDEVMVSGGECGKR